MRTATRILCLSSIFCVGAAYGMSARAHEAAAAPVAAADAGWNPVSQEVLDGMRGGYDVGNGLVASFGIDRAVYLNGNLVTQTSFNVPDVAHMTATQAAAMASALNAMSITQVGPNNTFDPSALGSTSGGTVIQNTLNNQNIQTITTLNTSVNSLNAFREAGFQQSLQQSQLQSLVH
ncbi:hypothetical protein SAMN04487785_103121 [Dyella jiangningensis]|uniref:hypothetical protein n=1 Tax=Dyella sp. AtDHG13 TaxID=1938897 RepID=UPI00087EB166|nr:hypothetical protein [Dyella sp. AtDHG13]PXV61716.1 hypothetical protein BDW41_101462 [Dyella sp. AtDHG13]SDJ66295.1 hypothetical protein SAMN04487785_103121 [Dyella jiangningensis]